MIIRTMNDLQTLLRTPSLARVAIALIVLAVSLGTGSQAEAAEAGSGTVCLASVPRPNSEEITLGNPEGGNRVFDFSVQIDNRPIQAISYAKGVRLTGLDLKRRHLIKIRNQGALIQSFFFRFTEYKSDDLCLWFKALYETWSLWSAEHARGICDCGPRTRR